TLRVLALRRAGRRLPARTLGRVGRREAVWRVGPRRFIATQPIAGLTIECVAQGCGVAREEDGKVAEVGLLRLDGRTVRQRQHERVARAEHLFQPLLQAGHDPALPEIVVDDELPAGFEVAAHVRERLAREEVTLKAYVA